MEMSNMKLSWLAKYLYLILIGFLAIALIFLSIFLYRNFYQAIAYSKEIIVLRQQVAVNDIDMNLFNLVIEKLEKRSEKRIVDWQKLKNPFAVY